MKSEDGELAELLVLQEKIESAKKAKARIEGELSSSMKRLEADFRTNDLVKVEEKIGKMKEQSIRIKEQIRTDLEKLQKEMGE